jgi:carboxyl-terminal processing protease
MNTNENLENNAVYTEETFALEKGIENANLKKQIKGLKIKNMFLKITSIFLALCIVALGGFVAYTLGRLGFFSKQSIRARLIATASTPGKVGSIDGAKLLTKIKSVEAILDNLYYYDLDKSKMETGIFAGIMGSLEDRYSDYYTPSAYTTMVEQTEGVYYGIGVVISQDPNTMVTTVIQVYKNSPGEEAGIKAGDVIVSADGTDVRKLESSELVKLIKGPEKTFVTVGVERTDENGTKKLLELKCQRRAVEIPTVEYEMLPDKKTGMLSITQFDMITVSQFKTAYEELKEKGMTQLVIDLRNNPGGVLDSVLQILDYILPRYNGKYTLNNDNFDAGQTLLVYTKNKFGIDSSFYGDDDHKVDVPIAVLTNGGSASASELFCGALRDYGLGIMVGEKTFGKGVVQNVINLDDGTAIKFTISEYFTPSGYSIEKKGIIPDFPIGFDGEKIEYNDDGSVKSKFPVASFSDATRLQNFADNNLSDFQLAKAVLELNNKSNR